MLTRAISRNIKRKPIAKRVATQSAATRFSSADRTSIFGSPKNIDKSARPISPHVRIYKFPVPAIASISHRITGGVLYGGAIVLALAGLVDPVATTTIIESFAVDHYILASIFKFPIATSFAYHFFAGLRHFYFDWFSKGLDNIKEIDSSSRLIMAATAVTSMLLTFVYF
eukprot:TRINITY_DN52_c0_g1_i1.p1 TRINITY_DN52_c0_g1~~TRINITY_DN52_c0_g1_i1.p1  ORF type:complete len:170 (-),score=5.19 TRINITY_DN52_c0_g1_i1:70-579(-)